MPHDIKQECLWIVRGYGRRKKAYRALVEQIMHGPQPGDGMPRDSSVGNPTESKAMRLAALEQYPEVQRMRAVERSLEKVGADIEEEGIRRKLRRALLLNCESGRKYPFEYLDMPGISRMDFYRRKERFLCDIAYQMNLTQVGTVHAQ